MGAFYICCDIRGTSKNRSWSSSKTQSAHVFLPPSPAPFPSKDNNSNIVSCDSCKEEITTKKNMATCKCPGSGFFPCRWEGLLNASRRPPFEVTLARGNWFPQSCITMTGQWGESVIQSPGPVHSWGTSLKSHPNPQALCETGWGL